MLSGGNCYKILQRGIARLPSQPRIPSVVQPLHSRHRQGLAVSTLSRALDLESSDIPSSRAAWTSVPWVGWQALPADTRAGASARNGRMSTVAAFSLAGGVTFLQVRGDLALG